jgi:hypothetical protein
MYVWFWQLGSSCLGLSDVRIQKGLKPSVMSLGLGPQVTCPNDTSEQKAGDKIGAIKLEFLATRLQ